MTAVEASGNSLQWKFPEVQTECWRTHTEVPSRWVDQVRVAKCSISLERKLK